MATVPLFIVLLIMLAVAGGTCWVVAARVAARFSAVTGPACAKCEYPLAGLDARVCPECGSNLAGSGTLQGGADPRRVFRQTFRRAILWTLGCFVALVVLPIPVNSAIPLQATYTGNYLLDLPSGGDTMRFDFDGTSRSKLRQAANVWFTAEPPTPLVVSATPDSPGSPVARKKVALPADPAMTPAQARAIVLASGFQGDEAQLDSVAGIVIEMNRRLRANVNDTSPVPGAVSLGGTSKTTLTQTSWAATVVALCIVIVWAWGLWKLSTRRKFSPAAPSA
jgi:hypothetical protein